MFQNQNRKILEFLKKRNKKTENKLSPKKLFEQIFVNGFIFVYLWYLLASCTCMTVIVGNHILWLSHLDIMKK